MHKNILIVAAHPDDEALGCGGTIARHLAEGDTVNVIFMADGETSRNSADKNTSLVRKTAAEKASQLLGISRTFYLGFPDNKMDKLPILEIIKPLENILQNISPEVIYTHHHGDLNIDHRITQQAVLTACRPQPGSSVRQIYSFEVISSSEWNHPLSSPFTPNYYVDISLYLEKKIEALQAYHQEMRNPPHSRSIQHVKSLALHRGHSMGMHAAEAFMLLRYLK